MADKPTLTDCFLFALRGSRRWDAGPIQVVGGVIGSLVIWWTGLKVPHEILDNPSLAAIVAMAVGGIAGAIFVFLVRLCWARVHFRLEKQGGLVATLRTKLGAHMGPVILMVAGLCSFLLLTGAGLIWFVLQPNGKSQAPELKSLQDQVRSVARLRKLERAKPSFETAGDKAIERLDLLMKQRREYVDSGVPSMRIVNEARNLSDLRENINTLKDIYRDLFQETPEFISELEYMRAPDKPVPGDENIADAEVRGEYRRAHHQRRWLNDALQEAKARIEKETREYDSKVLQIGN